MYDIYGKYGGVTLGMSSRPKYWIDAWFQVNTVHYYIIFIQYTCAVGQKNMARINE